MDVDSGDLALAELAAELEMQGGSEALDLLSDLSSPHQSSDSDMIRSSSPPTSSPSAFQPHTSPWAGGETMMLQQMPALSPNEDLHMRRSSGPLLSVETPGGFQSSDSDTVSFGTEVARLSEPPRKRKRQREEASTDELRFIPRELPTQTRLFAMGTDQSLHTVYVQFDPRFSGLRDAPAEVKEPGTCVHNKRNLFHLSYEFRVFDEASGTLVGDLPHGARQFYCGSEGSFVPVVKFAASARCVAVANGDWSEARDVALQHRPKGGGAAIALQDLPLERGALNKHDRLLFGESTSRKNGKAEEYFHVVIDLVAVKQDGTSVVMKTYATSPIIVLCANPASYRKAASSTAASKWESSSDGVISTTANVGIGTPVPEASLSVAGDVAITGTMFRPSDRRIKSKFKEVDKQEQLDRIRQLQLYDYEKKDPGTGKVLQERGVIAQELREIIPDSVKEVKMITKDGEHIDDFNVVDERRLMIETLGATQALDEDVRDLDDRVLSIEAEEKGGGGGGGGGASEILAIGAVQQGSMLPWVILLAFLVTILALVIVGGVVLVAVMGMNRSDTAPGDHPNTAYPSGTLFPSMTPSPYHVQQSLSATRLPTPSPSSPPSATPTETSQPTPSSTPSATPTRTQKALPTPTATTPAMDQCPPGSFWNGSRCTGCGQNGSCADCACGFAAVQGSPCLPCPYNTYSPEGGFACLPCSGTCPPC
mmetsp:Transcript_11296/g.45903  ORF Transcript_11296/g.45903 Transcript_11296/m.45903 type:complete len:709 (-) Transcript_11296:40-2166(-)